MSAFAPLLQSASIYQQGATEAASRSYNAEAMKLEAGAALQQADAAEEAKRRSSREFFGRQRAAIAQSGLGVGGSVLDVVADSELNAELDALNIRYEGATRATSLRNQSAIESMLGKAAKKQGRIGAVASLLSAPSSYYSSYSKMVG